MGPARTEIKRVADDLRTKLQAHAERLPAFAANKDNIQTATTTLIETRLSNPEDADDLIKTFTTSIKVLTSQDQHTRAEALRIAESRILAIETSLMQQGRL